MANPLKDWIKASREEQRRAPKRYLAGYTPDELQLVGHDEVHMTQETYYQIERECGRYDGTLPTGEYCGKMFLRGRWLCWYGIDRVRPMELIRLNYRKVVIKGCGRAL